MSWYVYRLIDPRDGKTFYVGKGCRDRHTQHVKDAKKGVPGKKCDRIREILATGREVENKIVGDFIIEEEAFAHEAKLIAQIGLENLTNITPGGGTPRAELTPLRMARSCARMSRVLVAHKEVGLRFGEHFVEVPRETMIEILSNGVAWVCKQLGPLATKTAFAKYGINLLEHEEYT